MNVAAARSTLARATTEMVADAASDVVWAGEYEGRWGVRMTQQVRDFTTVWFDVGERTVAFEAYVLPAPRRTEEVYRQCLFRNRSAQLACFAIDRDGDVYLVGRVPVAGFDAGAVDAVLGAVYQLVEVSFRGLVRAGFQREKTS